jgi:nucleoside phosphorylase
MIAVFAAMDMEVAACFGGSTPMASDDTDGFPLYREGDVVVCKTGIGRRAEQAAEALLSRHSPRMVLSVGVAGALVPGIAVGDLVVCRHVDHESHRHTDVEQTIYSDDRLLETALEAAREAGMSVRTGTSITTDEAAWGPAEKAAHHTWKAHDIVEMESFWIAEAAVRRGIPFLAVRSVSDSSADSLPNIGLMRPDGTLDNEKLIAHLRDHPETGEQLSRVAQNSRTALANLAAYLEVLSAALVAVSPAR